jgi:hypothetical protein
MLNNSKNMSIAACIVLSVLSVSHAHGEDKDKYLELEVARKVEAKETAAELHCGDIATFTIAIKNISKESISLPTKDNGLPHEWWALLSD